MTTTFAGLAAFSGARFMESAGFAHARFVGAADFGAAHFGGYAGFEDTEFTSQATFTRTRFCHAALFGRARFKAAADFGGAGFAGIADFGGAHFSDHASFRGVGFAGDARFGGTRFARDARFQHAELAGDADFDRCSAQSGLGLEEAVVTAGRHRLRLGSVDGGPLKVTVAEMRVEGDLVVDLGSGVALDAARITVRAPVMVTPGTRENNGGQLVSLAGADITAPFRVARRIDVSITTWGSLDLTHVSLADTSTLPRVGALYRLLHRPRVPAWAQAVADGRRRLAADHGRLGFVELQDLEGNYRDLRRQLEATGNTHGANDFYYGEMEARRRQLRWSSPIRWLLESYRAISGYGTRAGPAVIAWGAVTGAATRLLLVNGIDITEPGEHLSRSEVLRFAVDGSLSLFRPTEGPYLSVPETMIMVALRILGPLLLALAAIAVRNHTRR